METNDVYNLMNQLTQESKSLWRIKKFYLKEAKSKESKAFWNALTKDKEMHVNALKKLIKKELK
ncbi:MAG TPA: hypothetical protein VG982_00300 [Candidatus Paceibacterota bacterium]|nr:hypothetical protein [Candidatus Paceibacterota bacterium]